MGVGRGHEKLSRLLDIWLAGRVSPDSTDQNADFRLFSWDHLCIYRLYRRIQVPLPIAFVVILILLMGPKLALAAATGELTSPTLPQDFASDMKVFPPVKLVSTIGGRLLAFGVKPADLGQKSDATGGARDRMSSTRLPYLRDYVDISLMVVFAFGMTLGLYVSRRIESLIPTLRSTGALNPKAITDNEIRSLVMDTNRVLSHPGVFVGVVIVSAGLVFGIWVVLASHGVYPSLGPEHDPAWQQELYAGSWLHHGGILGITLVVTHLVSWTIIVTSMLLGVALGLVLVRLMHRANRLYAEPRREFLFIPVFGYPDGALGQSQVRTLFVCVWIEVVLVAIGIGMIYLWLPKPQALYVTPLVLMYVILNPLYALLPFIHINRWNETWKRERVWELHGSLDRLVKELPSSSHDSTGISRRLLELQSLESQLNRYRTYSSSLFTPALGAAFLGGYTVTVGQVVVFIVRYAFLSQGGTGGTQTGHYLQAATGESRGYDITPDCKRECRVAQPLLRGLVIFRGLPPFPVPGAGWVRVAIRRSCYAFLTSLRRVRGSLGGFWLRPQKVHATSPT